MTFDIQEPMLAASILPPPAQPSLLEMRLRKGDMIVRCSQPFVHFQIASKLPLRASSVAAYQMWRPSRHSYHASIASTPHALDFFDNQSRPGYSDHIMLSESCNEYLLREYQSYSPLMY
jgi:hypothetical protein